MSSVAIRAARVPALPVSFVMGTAITLTLFWGLQQLISGPVGIPTFTPREPPKYSPLKPPTISDPVPPAPKPVPPRPSDPTGGGAIVRITDTPVGPPSPGPRIPNTTFDPGTPQSQPLPMDQDAMQRIAPQPDYPVSAKTNGIEGWVLVEFTVMADGAVANPVVIDAEPKGTFDKAVLRAVNGWKYSPRISNGVAVERPGMRVVLKFHLED